MGGIGGVPFVGKTGFMAFSNHVPDNGNVLILFGPHIAISESGELGKYLRQGQSKESTACGAVLAAYNSCCSGSLDFAFDESDMQQCWLRSSVAKAMPKIQAAEEPISALVHAAYESIKEEMMTIVNTDFGSGKLVLIGGVQINMPAPFEDHFQPLMFQVCNPQEKPTATNGTDLLQHFMHQPPAPRGWSEQCLDCDSRPLTRMENGNTSPTSTSEHLDTFAWLNWSPKPTTPCCNTLLRCFPGALPGTAVLRRMLVALEPLGFTPENTIYGQSICPDEINNEKGNLSSLMAEHWGECFPMGGIGGVPFVGKTGFMAFSHHVPDNGNVLILFGPHIAISESGELGKYLRQGQSKESTACGAVLAALNSCCAGNLFPFDESDMQQCWLRNSVTKAMPKIQAAEEPISALIHATYESIKEEMMTIVNTDFGSGKLVLIGGVQINMPAPFEDHFQPLMFQVCNPQEKPTATNGTDLLQYLICQPPVPRRWSEHCSDCDSRQMSSELKPERLDTFAWLNWSPKPSTPCCNTLLRCFPGALPGTATLRRMLVALEPLGFTPENTIYGQSICPDEINNEKGNLSSLMAEHWGECFPMGGIGGVPFVGKTGFMAFSNHVPDNGNVLILFGPHIAISESGELGKYLRQGQSKESTACGAVLAAYNSCCSGSLDFAFDESDMQQCWLRSSVAKAMPKIQAAEEPISALVHAAYESIKEEMMTIVNTDFGSGKLVLIGGVQINMPAPFEDHFQPLMFQVCNPQEKPTATNGTDLLQHFMHQPPAPRGWSEQCLDCDSRLLTRMENGNTSPTSTSEHLDTFAWLNWSPKPTTPCCNTLLRCFPGVLPGTAVLRRMLVALEPLGFTPENTIYGQSICPDEINNEKGNLSSLMAEHWGECFPMGGIGGVPFVGKTGFMAFSNHVPDNGNVLILFGPHIAISESGELGKYLRQGQSKESTACGAVLAAYNSCCSGSLDFAFDESDMQQCWLRNSVTKALPKIQAAEEPISALIHATYESIKEQMFTIVNTDFGSGKLVLIGGVQINMPAPFEDHFQPLMFQVASEDHATVDLLSQLKV
ncbi:hypothetical protein CYMTET_22272 [Cymbomonas tetramitiformis]|uniref:Limiting CO2-inducible protein B/C beta carbonyic anhydrase domain-containing protein n=1 Tax=Cymbomonas tetramitiformis TaxID=36881 RepID=A0AAE0G155_9CHLO|nr:hypothetical protein CYMTET_22272 [Cymbomonas tetramitiformis]